MKQLISISNRTGIPFKALENYYKVYWLYINTIIEKLPLKDDMNEKDFNSLKVNFNIPNLGKLACSYNRYLGVHKKYKREKKENGGDKSN